MSKKFTSTIVGASIFISVVGLFSRGLGFIREMIFANNFGLEKEFDLYLVGAVLPITINTIILYIGQNFLVPGFQKLNSTDINSAKKFYKQSFVIFFGAGIILAFVLFLASNLIINYYMGAAPSESKAIAENIFKLFLVTIPFAAGVSIFSALLQALYEFKFPAISILFLNVSIIILLVMFSDSLGVYVIPLGYIAGTIFQFIYLMSKSFKFSGLDLKFSFSKITKLKTVISSSLFIIIIIESIGQLYSIFDRYFYQEISAGGIASLNYAYILYYLPISILSISLATAIFPKITEAIVNSNRAGIENIYNGSLSLNIVIFIPVTFLLFYFGDTFLKVAFERGKFLKEDTAMTFGVLKYYSFSLIFYASYSVLNKIFYSLNFIKILLLLTVGGIFLKLFTNLLLVEKFQQDGLAASTSISYIFFFVASYLILNYKLGIKDKFVFTKEFFYSLLNAGLTLLVVKLVSVFFVAGNLYQNFILIFLFVLIYLLNLYLLDHKSISTLNILYRRINPFNQGSD